MLYSQKASNDASEDHLLLQQTFQEIHTYTYITTALSFEMMAMVTLKKYFFILLLNRVWSKSHSTQ